MSYTTDTSEKLEAVLTTLESTVAEEIRHAFYLLEPVPFAKLMNARGLSIPIKSKLLPLKVELPVYEGVDLSPLLEREAQRLWTRLAAEFPNA